MSKTSTLRPASAHISSPHPAKMHEVMSKLRRLKDNLDVFDAKIETMHSEYQSLNLDMDRIEFDLKMLKHTIDVQKRDTDDEAQARPLTPVTESEDEADELCTCDCHGLMPCPDIPDSPTMSPKSPSYSPTTPTKSPVKRAETPAPTQTTLPWGFSPLSAFTGIAVPSLMPEITPQSTPQKEANAAACSIPSRPVVPRTKVVEQEAKEAVKECLVSKFNAAYEASKNLADLLNAAPKPFVPLSELLMSAASKKVYKPLPLKYATPCLGPRSPKFSLPPSRVSIKQEPAESAAASKADNESHLKAVRKEYTASKAPRPDTVVRPGPAPKRKAAKEADERIKIITHIDHYSSFVPGSEN